MHSENRPHRIGLLVLTLAFAPLYACTHLHNAGNAALAEGAAKEFEAFRKSSSDPYAIMLRNQAKLEASTSKGLAAIAADRAESTAIKVANLTWADIETDLRGTVDGIVKARQALSPELPGLCPPGDEAEALEEARKDAKAALVLLKSTLKSQKEAEARRVLFNESMRVLVGKAADGSSLDTDTLKEARNTVLDHEVDYLTVDDDGRLTTATSTVKDSLPASDLKVLQSGNIRDVVRSYTIAQFDPKSQPGLAVVLLGMARDLAQSNIQRLTLCSEYRQVRLGLLAGGPSLDQGKNALARLEQHRNFLRPDEKVVATFDRAYSEKSPRLAQEAFRGAAGYVLTETLEKSGTRQFRVKAANVDHEYSIRLSALNAREREAAIASGLTGLKMYHTGGLTSEDVANLIRAAQAVATAVIAGGVY